MNSGKKPKKRGLFNLFLPNRFEGSPGLTNLEYSCCSQIMGRCYWAAQSCVVRYADSSQTMNCHAPETGNIELLAKYCNKSRRKNGYSPFSTTRPPPLHIPWPSWM
ncbi:hypothetical protein LZ30DRAFT_797266 [Colletotrichum cereale]|nr:hypothetical protein LZ30DRAFT_797266 [Colletotrichum cereale]